MSLPKEFYQYNRHLLAYSAGVMAAYFPTNKSNINPYLMSALFALFVVKVLLGDYDTGYQFSFSDIVFVLATSIAGMIGAFFAIKANESSLLDFIPGRRA